MLLFLVIKIPLLEAARLAADYSAAWTSHGRGNILAREI